MPQRKLDPSQGPSPADQYAGARLRQLRTLLGMSQDKLAEALGVTFQQIQKYENAQNRISVSRLQDIAHVLNVAPSYFFSEPSPNVAAGFAESGQAPLEGAPAPTPLPSAQVVMPPEFDLLHRRETLDLVRAWYAITDLKQRRKIFDLIKSMSNAGS